MAKLRFRGHGSATLVASITLIQGQDEAVIQTLEKTDNAGGLIAAALRAYVDRFAGLEPGQRFRQRKDGRLVLHAALEFYPRRDEPLIQAIAAAPADMVEAVLVELMRTGSGSANAGADPSAPAQTETLNTAGLALEL